MKRAALIAVPILLALAAMTWWRLQVASVHERVVAAETARKNGQFDAAEKELLGLPDELPVQVEKAEIRLARGDLRGAHALLTLEAAQTPDDAHFWARYGFTSAVLGDAEVAKMALTRAAMGSPGEAEAATHLVQLIEREDTAHASEKFKSLAAEAKEPAVKAVFEAASAK